MGDTTQTTFDVPVDDSTVHESYVNALHHGNAEIPADATCVGVVNITMYGIEDLIETNFEVLGPPTSLFEDFREKRDVIEDDGVPSQAAHNMAWDDVQFESRYEEYLSDGWSENTAVRDACEEILSMMEEQPVAIVCYEGADRNCHRHVLQRFLNEKSG